METTGVEVYERDCILPKSVIEGLYWKRNILSRDQKEVRGGHACAREQKHSWQREYGSRLWAKSMTGTFEEKQRASESLCDE